MPVISLDPTAQVLTRVCGSCRARSEHAFSSLQVVADEDSGLGRLALPGCACGAYEHLLQTTDTAPDEAVGSTPDRQRRVVNWLVKHLHPQARPSPDMPTGAGPWVVSPEER